MSNNAERSPWFGMPLCEHRIQFDCDQCRRIFEPVVPDWQSIAEQLSHALRYWARIGGWYPCDAQAALDRYEAARYRSDHDET